MRCLLFCARNASEKWLREKQQLRVASEIACDTGNSLQSKKQVIWLARDSVRPLYMQASLFQHKSIVCVHTSQVMQDCPLFSTSVLFTTETK